MKSIDRLIEYLEIKEIKPTRFEKDIGLSNGYLGTQLKRKADLGESIIVKIIDNCLDLDVIWFLTGQGSMLKPEPKSEITGMVREPSVAIEIKKNGCSYCAAKDIRIADLEKTIRLLEKLIASLEREIDHYKKS